MRRALAILGLLVPGALLFSGACSRTGDPAGRPNVLILVMDTTRGDRCSANGYARPTTPGLERLARESTIYTDAWSPSSWTAPAHASLFTGLRPEHHGLMLGTRSYLDEGAETLAEILGAAGWRTALFSANPMVGPEFGLTQGFGTYELAADREPGTPPTARWAARRAVEFAKETRSAGRPFLVAVNAWEPHLAYEPPEAFASRFLAADADPRRVARARAFEGTTEVLFGRGWRGIDARGWRILSDLYDAEIATLDAEIDTMVADLRREGLLDDTILVVTADHGENLGDHGLCGHSFSLHRTLLHVPLLVRFPSRFEKGGVVGDPVRLEDLFPTVLEACGLPVPEGIDGRSLGSDVAGRTAFAALGHPNLAAIERDFPGFVATGYGLERRSIYDGRHHLIHRADGVVELYDVAEDPDELENLADRETETRERLLHRLFP